jgi:hypothetical protein
VEGSISELVMLLGCEDEKGGFAGLSEVRLNNQETNMAQKAPNQENSEKNVLLYPVCREKKGRTCCPTPKQTLFL